MTPPRALQELLRDGKLAGSWTLDAARSEIGLKSKSMWGLVPVKGVFREVTGSGTVSAAGDVAGTVTVAAASVDTKMKKRDDHLRSADFFDVANTPDITFAVEQVTPSGEGVTVTGTLTVRGPYPSGVLRRAGLRPRRGAGGGGRRAPGQPDGLRPELEPAGHVIGAQHDHRPRRIHQAVRRGPRPLP